MTASTTTPSPLPPYFQNPHLDPSPRYLPGSQIGVLLIHGYTATPAEVSLLGDYLHDRGCTVSCPLLPGHATTIEQLHQVKWQDWADHVALKYAQLKSDCSTVFVGGESLGGLLAAYLGLKNPDISGLILNAPALYPKSRLASLVPVLKYFMKGRQKSRGASNPVVDQRWQGYTIDSVPAVSQLMKLQRTIRHALPGISQPTIIFQGLLDETIKPEGAQVIYDHISSNDKTLVWMKDSSHCVLLDIEWETIARQTEAFIRRITGT